jgi:RNA polymerase sigma-70 factor (ECF subfamily)
MRRVLRSRLLDIERTAKADKRGGGERPLSLDAPATRGDEDATLPEARLADADDTEMDAVARLSRAALLSNLSRRQRELALGLEAGLSMSELSKRLRVPRTTLYDELRRVRETFRDEDLSKFLD